MRRTLLSLLVAICASANFNLSTAFQSGELTTNGGFELGDTSSWEYFPTPSSTFNVTNDAAGGSFAGELFNPDPGSGAVIKQANIGIGVVNPGDLVRISFAAKGSFAEGGVAFAEFFSELAGGGTSANEILGGGPLPLTGEWQDFCYTAIAGPDVSGGITLQIVAATGATPGSVAVVFIDEVSVSTGELTVNGGFEFGDTSFWQSFPSPNSTFNITNDANSGSFAAELFNPDPAAGAVVKQANLAVGFVNPGDEISISFAAKGSSAAGGVAFAEFFSEISSGGTSANEILGGGPLGLTADWQIFNFTTFAGPDVSGGVTLQFAAVTGADPASVSVLFIDDASVSIEVDCESNEPVPTCFCDAGFGPCGNDDPAAGCANSTGLGALLEVSGSASLSADSLVLGVTNTANNSGLFFQGDLDLSPGDLFGDGLRCCGGNVIRIGTYLPSGNATDTATGNLTGGFGPPISGLGGQNIAPGDTRCYQWWYRDNGGPCSTGFNLSNAVLVTWEG